MDELKQKQTKHLKRLLNDLSDREISQKAFANEIGFSEVSVSRWKSGQTSVKHSTAEIIHEHYPDYSVEYLLGYSDYKNADEERYAETKHKLQRDLRISDCVNGIVELVGAKTNFENESYIDADENYHPAGYFEIIKDGKTARLTIDQMTFFENEVMAYVEMRLNKMLERGAW